jgi:hypothetical protein
MARSRRQTSPVWVPSAVIFTLPAIGLISSIGFTAQPAALNAAMVSTSIDIFMIVSLSFVVPETESETIRHEFRRHFGDAGAVLQPYRHIHRQS